MIVGYLLLLGLLSLLFALVRLLFVWFSKGYRWTPPYSMLLLYGLISAGISYVMILGQFKIRYYSERKAISESAQYIVDQTGGFDALYRDAELLLANHTNKIDYRAYKTTNGWAAYLLFNLETEWIHQSTNSRWLPQKIRNLNPLMVETLPWSEPAKLRITLGRYGRRSSVYYEIFPRTYNGPYPTNWAPGHVLTVIQRHPHIYELYK